MKKFLSNYGPIIISTIMILIALMACASCYSILQLDAEKSNKKELEYKKTYHIKAIKYVHDSRSELCFAVGDNTNCTNFKCSPEIIINVPCTKKVLEISDKVNINGN